MPLTRDEEEKKLVQARAVRKAIALASRYIGASSEEKIDINTSLTALNIAISLNDITAIRRMLTVIERISR